MDGTAGTKASATQRKALTILLENGGDRLEAYVNSRQQAPAASPAVVRRRSSEFWSTLTMKKLLREADFEARIQMERKAAIGVATAIETYGITKDRIMAELAKIAFAQQTDVMSWGPDGVVVKESSEIGDASAAVGEVSQSGGGDNPIAMKIKMLDKRQALIDLGKEIGMFQQQVNHKGQVQMAVGAKFILEGKD